MTKYEKMYEKMKDRYEEPIETVESVVEPMPNPEEKFGVVANCEKAYIREGASTDTSHKVIVDKGDRLLMYGSENGWYKVETESGCCGYIRGDLVQIDQ